MAVAIILQIVLIALNAVFASAEIAVVSCNETKLKKMAEDGNKRAARLTRLTEQPARFLSTIQVAITLAGLLGSAFAADNFAEPLTNWLVGLGVPIPADTLNTICVVLITLVLSYFNIVFGELVPKRIAMKNAEKTALGMSGMLGFVSVIFAPLVALLTVSTNGLLRLFGIKPNESDDERVTAEEIILMADAGRETGTIEEDETEMIKSVFEFKEKTAGEACTHRKDADILFTEDSDAVWADTIKGSRHTYYPVCGDTVDDVVGVLNTKDYFRLDDRSRDSVMKNAVDPAVFVPESMPADSLFAKMRSTREFVAIVVDEYGGMRGIITIHDLVELLVGDLTDKDEEADYSIRKTGENEWTITGLAPMDEVQEALGIKLEGDDVDEYEIFGGYVCGRLGRVPDDGTTAVYEDDVMRVDILAVADRRVEKVKVTLKPKSVETEEEDGVKKLFHRRRDKEDESDKHDKSDDADHGDKADPEHKEDHTEEHEEGNKKRDD